MNEGVKILIERMKTNPEEFIADGYSMTKWGGLISQYRDYLNEEDKKTLTDALNEITQQRFTEAVMKELLAPEEDNSLGKPWYSNTANLTLGVGQTLGAYANTATATATATGTWTTTTATATTPSLTIGSTTLDEDLIKHVRAHKAYLDKLDKEAKQHQTLFGKLKNYLHNFLLIDS